MKTDIIVIGAGPVGLFTVFEAGILGLNCVLIDNLDKPGGQCAELYPDKPIYDIPGVPYQTGQEHVDALLKQIEPFDYKLLLNQRVDEIRNVGDSWEVKTSENKLIKCRSYQIIDTSESGLPSDAYKSVIVSGAKQNNLPKDYVQKLEGIRTNGVKDVEILNFIDTYI